MWYIILLLIVVVCLVVIFVIFKKNISKVRGIEVKETVQEKQMQVKKRLLESKLEKSFINFGKTVLAQADSFFNKFKKDKKSIRIVKKKKGYSMGMPAKLKKEKKEVELDDDRKKAGLLLEAEASLKKRQIDEAEDKFIELLQMDAKNISAYMGLGKIYVARKEWQTAEEAYRYIIKIDKKFLDGYRELARVFELTKRWDELKKLGQEILNLGHREAWIYEKLGMAYKKTGYPDKAENYFKSAVEIEPQNERLLDELLEVAIINKNKPLAKKAFNTLSGISRDEMKIQGYRDKIDIL